MDTGERTSDNGQSTEETGLKSSVLTRGTFTVVVVTNDDPLDTLVTIIRSSLRDSSPFSGDLVLNLVRLAVLNVDGTNQAVLRDVLEMTTILEPGSTSGDVISRYRTNKLICNLGSEREKPHTALALNLDQNRKVLRCLSVPWLEGFQEL